MFCRTVTRPCARRETVPVVKPAASASVTTPNASDPEVVILTIEVAVEEHAAASGSAAVEEGVPPVLDEDSPKDIAKHVSLFNFLSLSCLFIGCAIALPMGVAPEATCDWLQSGVGSRVSRAFSRAL